MSTLVDTANHAPGAFAVLTLPHGVCTAGSALQVCVGEVRPGQLLVASTTHVLSCLPPLVSFLPDGTLRAVELFEVVLEDAAIEESVVEVHGR